MGLEWPETVAPLLLVAEVELGFGGGAMDVGLLFRFRIVVVWCSIAESMLSCGSGISSMGDSRAGVARDCCRYLGVRGPEDAGGVI